MGGEGFLSSSLKRGEAIFQGWDEGLSEWWIGSRFVSEEKGEVLVELWGTELWTNLADVRN